MLNSDPAKPKKAGKKAARKAREALKALGARAAPAKGQKGLGASGNGHDLAPASGALDGAALDAMKPDPLALAIRSLLHCIGDDPDRAGLADTPARVAAAWRGAWGLGYRQKPPLLRCFPEAGIDYDEMVVLRGITFHSHCEHHLAPFFGTCDIGYLPVEAIGVVGLSKLARVVEHFSRRLQVQERLTAEIADYLGTISPNVAVRIRAQHLCMCSRGVAQQSSMTTTTVLRGKLKVPAARAEFLDAAR